MLYSGVVHKNWRKKNLIYRINNSQFNASGASIVERKKCQVPWEKKTNNWQHNIFSVEDAYTINETIVQEQFMSISSKNFSFTIIVSQLPKYSLREKCTSYFFL